MDNLWAWDSQCQFLRCGGHQGLLDANRWRGVIGEVLHGRGAGKVMRAGQGGAESELVEGLPVCCSRLTSLKLWVPWGISRAHPLNQTLDTTLGSFSRVPRVGRCQRAWARAVGVGIAQVCRCRKIGTSRTWVHSRDCST